MIKMFRSTCRNVDYCLFVHSFISTLEYRNSFDTFDVYEQAFGVYYYASETNLRATPILEPSSSHHLCITWGCSILLFLTQ